MKRRLLNLAVWVSLILCVAAVALWVRSYIGKGVHRAWLSQSERYHLEATKGNVNVGFRPVPAAKLAISYWETTLAVTVIHGTMGRRFLQVIFPLWMPTVIFSVYPLIRAVQWYRRPAPAGLCPSCGYDLRGITERCPECGTPIAG
jgi:hypothetical protein